MWQCVLTTLAKLKLFGSKYKVYITTTQKNTKKTFQTPQISHKVQIEVSKIYIK